MSAPDAVSVRANQSPWPRRIAGLLALLVWAGAARDVSAALSPSIGQINVKVATSTAEKPAIGALVVTIDGLKAQAPGEAVQEGVLSAVKDLEKAASSPPTVEFDSSPLPLPAAATQRRWILPFKLFNMPAGATLTRYVTFKVDGVDWALAYELTSPPAVATTWSLKPPPTSGRGLMKDDDSAAIPISVSITGDLAVKNLRVVLDPIEAQSKRSLSQAGWKLCKKNPDTSCDGAGIELVGAGIHALWAVPADLKKLKEGKYEGMLTVASTDKSSGESVSFAINVTSWTGRVFGLAAIAAGVLLATYVTVFLRLRVFREEMLEAAVALREVHDNIDRALKAVNDRASPGEIVRKLSQVNHDLTDDELLKKNLPTTFPSPWTRLYDASRLEVFKRHIEAQGAWLNALTALVDGGIVPLVEAVRGHGHSLTEAQRDAFELAVKRIDALAATSAPATPAALAPLVDEEVRTFKESLVEPAFDGSRAAWSARQPRSLQELRLRMAHTNVAAWAFLLLITILVGAYTLILTNPAFGTELDFLTCFFWGLGLPTGAALASATTSTVATSFNVVRPQ